MCWCVVFTGTRDNTLLGKISYTPDQVILLPLYTHADSELRSGDDNDVRTRYTHSLGQETETE